MCFKGASKGNLDPGSPTLILPASSQLQLGGLGSPALWQPGGTGANWGGGGDGHMGLQGTGVQSTLGCRELGGAGSLRVQALLWQLCSL